jgi:hypothetical protein
VAKNQSNQVENFVKGIKHLEFHSKEYKFGPQEKIPAAATTFI